RLPRPCPCRSNRTCAGPGRSAPPSVCASVRRCCAAEPCLSLERDVVVGAALAEVRLRGLRRGRRGNELVAAALAAAVAAAEELDVVGDDLDRLALGAVLRVPLPPVQAPVDRDRAALGEELGAGLALVAPDRDVEVVRLVAPLAGLVVLLAGVDRDPELADGVPARGVPELGIPGQVAHEDDAVDVGHYSSSECERLFAEAYSRS